MTEASDRLTDLIGPGGRLFVLSNRGPVSFQRSADEPAGLTAERGPGGLVTALGDLGRHAPVTWIAAAMSEGDRIAARHFGGALMDLVPMDGSDPAEPATGENGRTGRNGRHGNGSGGAGHRTAGSRGLAGRVAQLLNETLPGQDIRLRYITLPEEVFDGHYRIVANPFLWFVQHQMYAPAYAPNVDAALLEAWRTGYRAANQRLADAAVDAAAGVDRPVFLVQDYHLYLAPARIRERLPNATILHFNHIPWPPESTWQMLPQSIRRSICEGLLASDIVGLQTDRYASHFLETVASFVRDAKVDRDGRSVRWHDRRISVRSYPISIDPEGLLGFARSSAVGEKVDRLRARLERAGNPRLIVRADRIEPSKNALRGFLAFEELLDRRPELRRKVRFVAVQAPTRTKIAEYADYARAVREVIARINGLAEPDDQPIWIYDGSDYAMAIGALRLADVVLVNPIVDGMNLVAKEAVLVGERDPALVLSETAGAAEQMAGDSLTVAPADVMGTAEQLERALLMPTEERRARAKRLRQSVRHEDLDWWLGRQVRDLSAVRGGAVAPSRRLRDTVRRVESPVAG